MAANARLQPRTWRLDSTDFDVTYHLETSSNVRDEIRVSADNFPGSFKLDDLCANQDITHTEKTVETVKQSPIKAVDVPSDAVVSLQTTVAPKVSAPTILSKPSLKPTMAAAQNCVDFSKQLYWHRNPKHNDVSEITERTAGMNARKAWHTAANAARRNGEECPPGLLRALFETIVQNGAGYRDLEVSSFISFPFLFYFLTNYPIDAASAFQKKNLYIFLNSIFPRFSSYRMYQPF